MSEPNPTYPTMADPPNMGFQALGNSAAKFERLETFPAPEHLVAVQMESDELTALCPVTGQPDMYRLHIELLQTPRCLESKSLKLYVQTFRDQGLFCEALAARIAAEILAAVEGGEVKVNLAQKRRGGISIQAVAIAGEPAQSFADAFPLMSIRSWSSDDAESER